MSIPWGDQAEQGPLLNVPGPFSPTQQHSQGGRGRPLLHPPLGLQFPAHAA